MAKDDIAQIRVGDHKVGLVGLNEAMVETSKSPGATTDEDVAQELLSRIKRRNYIPDAAREIYKEALLREFKRFIGRSDAEGEEAQGLSVKILGQGCAQCDGLEREVIDVMAKLDLEAEIEHVRDIKEIAKLGVMSVPALVINGKVKSVGSVPPRARIIAWLKEAQQNRRKEDR